MRGALGWIASKAHAGRLASLAGARDLGLRGRAGFAWCAVASRKPEGREYVIRTPSGPLFLDGGTLSVDLGVVSDVFLYRCYGFVDVRDADVLDIGAHKGYFAKWAALRGAHSVVAYEPEPHNAGMLRRLAASHHGPTRLEARPEAVWTTDGTVALNLSHTSWTHSILVAEPGGRQIEVACVTLRSILEQGRDHRIVVKIDAEGAECALILETPSDVLRRASEIVFEFHEFSPCTLEELTGHLRTASFGYAGASGVGDLHLYRRTPPR